MQGWPGTSHHRLFISMRNAMHAVKMPLVLAVIILAGAWSVAGSERITNSLGMVFVRVDPATFVMGETNPAADIDRCYDEFPAHEVRLTRPFYISVTEVTVDQFAAFKPGFKSTEAVHPYAAGMSWFNAVEFCRWLSEKEGRPYRLPTEAEWEYAARQADKLGLENMLADPLEWCFDWYGSYRHGRQTDPLGRSSGLTKVVRGGRLDDTTKRDAPELYRHLTHRSSMAPAFGRHDTGSNVFGAHRIGFRVVMGELPRGELVPPEPCFATAGVRMDNSLAKLGPQQPYFRKRHLLPVPPDNSERAAIDLAGFPPFYRGHNHSPALTVCPNGDVLAVFYTSYTEYESEVSLMISRLRFGADEWDFPCPFVDFAGANDHAPLMFTDGQTVRLFWGNPELTSAFPFQWIESIDNGMSWSQVLFPRFVGVVGPHDRQPINTAFRAANGTIYVASDAKGRTSVLWASPDDGLTWYDPGGRSAGRHTAYVELSEGAILGLGGKNTEIDGFMPQAVSRDGGRTWSVSRSVFPALGNNQRPCVIRLQSGRLLYVGDFQDVKGNSPPGITNRGCFVALSDDDGRSWRIKPLPGTQPHERPDRVPGATTLGYCVVRQAPNGMIHLITSMNHPCLHFEFNEAWILSDEPILSAQDDVLLMRSRATRMLNVNRYEERDRRGRIRGRWSGGIADDGRWLLHGRLTWFYPNGQVQWEAQFQLGRKVGREVFWAPDGRKVWVWYHRPEGPSTWIQYWPNGRERARSTWSGFFCDGPAELREPSGRLRMQGLFESGRLLLLTQW